MTPIIIQAQGIFFPAGGVGRNRSLPRGMGVGEGAEKMVHKMEAVVSLEAAGVEEGEGAEFPVYFAQYQETREKGILPCVDIHQSVPSRIWSPMPAP